VKCPCLLLVFLIYILQSEFYADLKMPYLTDDAIAHILPTEVNNSQVELYSYEKRSENEIK
jgi:hypothetical protein